MRNFLRLKSLHGSVLLISLSLSLLSCESLRTLPKAPAYKEWRFIRAPQVENSYFYYTDGNEIEERIFIRDIPVKPANDSSDIWVGFKIQDRNKILRYQSDLQKWIPKHCKD